MDCTENPLETLVLAHRPRKKGFQWKSRGKNFELTLTHPMRSRVKSREACKTTSHALSVIKKGVCGSESVHLVGFQLKRREKNFRGLELPENETEKFFET